MTEDLVTEDGVYWTSDGDNICILHLNEQWPCWLSKQDLLLMIKYLEIEEAHK